MSTYTVEDLVEAARRANEEAEDKVEAPGSVWDTCAAFAFERAKNREEKLGIPMPHILNLADTVRTEAKAQAAEGKAQAAEEEAQAAKKAEQEAAAAAEAERVRNLQLTREKEEAAAAAEAERARADVAELRLSDLESSAQVREAKLEAALADATAKLGKATAASASAGEINALRVNAIGLGLLHGIETSPADRNEFTELFIADHEEAFVAKLNELMGTYLPSTPAQEEGDAARVVTRRVQQLQDATRGMSDSVSVYSDNALPMPENGSPPRDMSKFRRRTKHNITLKALDADAFVARGTALLPTAILDDLSAELDGMRRTLVALAMFVQSHGLAGVGEDQVVLPMAIELLNAIVLASVTYDTHDSVWVADVRNARVSVTVPNTDPDTEPATDSHTGYSDLGLLATTLSDVFLIELKRSFYALLGKAHAVKDQTSLEAVAYALGLPTLFGTPVPPTNGRRVAAACTDLFRLNLFLDVGSTQDAFCIATSPRIVESNRFVAALAGMLWYVFPTLVGSNTESNRDALMPLGQIIQPLPAPLPTAGQTGYDSTNSQPKRGSVPGGGDDVEAGPSESPAASDEGSDDRDGGEGGYKDKGGSGSRSKNGTDNSGSDSCDDDYDNEDGDSQQVHLGRGARMRSAHLGTTAADLAAHLAVVTPIKNSALDAELAACRRAVTAKQIKSATATAAALANITNATD